MVRPFTPSLTRRSALTVIAGGGLALSARHAAAEAKEGRAIYPVAVPVYQTHFVADKAGFFRDAGLDCKLVQGGSGVKTREIIASSQGDRSEDTRLNSSHAIPSRMPSSA